MLQISTIRCAIVSHPADNLVSFLNNAKGATIRDEVNKLGLWGLFTRGLPLRILMIGTLTGAQWCIYDAFKVLAGMPTSGAGAPSVTPAIMSTTILRKIQNDPITTSITKLAKL